MGFALMALGFFSIFHVVGGVAIGGTLRGLRQGSFSFRSVFLLIWGTMFAGIPLCIGLGVFLGERVPQLVLAQLAVILLAIGLAALVPDSFLDSFRTPEFGVVGGGGLFLVVGVGMAAALIRTEPVNALLILCVFGGMGGAALVAGVVRVLKRP